MRTDHLYIMVLFAITIGFGQSVNRYSGPIIDMHLHAYADDALEQPIPNPATGEISVDNATEHRRQTIAMLEKHNIVLAVIDGRTPAVVDAWEQDRAGGIIRGLRFFNPEKDPDVDRFEQWVKAGTIELFGEVGTTYAGYSPSDPVLDPYWEICEQYDIPVAIHTGGSFPGIHLSNPQFRLRYGDPFLVEDILVNYPDLSVYLMHAGGHFYERAAMLMVQYPNLYVDIAVLNWVPEASHFLKPFLKLAKAYDVLDRVMYGSDQMRWPEAMDTAIQNIQSIDFLTQAEKRGIFYGNAARFLNLSEETISNHQKRK